MAVNQIPNRFTGATPEAVSDIYDKLNFLLSKQATSPSVASTSTTTTDTVTKIISIQGASGQAATPQYAFIPILATVPSNNPTQGAPYAVNGLTILVNDQLWRYAGAPTYAWQQVATGTVLLDDTHANRVVNYPAANYPDALFVETDTLLLLQSIGAIWTTLAGSVQDTHANRLSNWPSVQFSVGTQFFESDRTVTYVVENATGTVSTSVSGTTYTVTWVSGNHFVNTGAGFTAAQWPAGTPIVIDGVTYTVKAVASDISLTLNTSAGTQTGVNYSVASGRWVYLSGECSTVQASIPADLGENDVGLLENVSDYAHILEWTGLAFTWGPGESGSGYFQDFAVVPTASGWQICDGSAGIAYLKKDGTTGTITVPNTVSTPAYRKLGATYASAITAATVPTLAMTSYTPAGTVSTPTLAMNSYTPAGSISGATFTGAAVALTSGTFTPVALATTAITSVGGSTTSFTPSGSISGETFSGTPATLTGTISTPTFTGTPATLTGTISLPADPVAHFQAMQYFRQ